jgi:GNAT superfamily N-acetyltransferase
MLDATQRASADVIVDFFELLDLDPEVDEIVYEEEFRYNRHPNGRLGSDILLDVYAFGHSADETIARVRALGAEVPHWLEPFGTDDDRDLQRYAAEGYRALGQWFVMRHRMDERPAAGAVPVELVTDAETEAMLAALQNVREDVGHRVRPGQYADPRFIQCWISVEGAVAAIGQTVIVQDCAYVCEMVTFPDYRRRGFAGALFQELLGHAYDRGAREAILVSTPMAHELYRSLGFTDVVPIRVFEWRPPDTDA